MVNSNNGDYYDFPEEALNEFVEHRRFSLIPNQIVYHEIPSANLFPIKRDIEIKELILGLKNDGTGDLDWTVKLLPNPIIWYRFNCQTHTLYDAYHELIYIHGVDDEVDQIPSSKAENMARQVYRGVEKVLESGKFRYHIFHDGSNGIEELIDIDDHDTILTKQLEDVAWWEENIEELIPGNEGRWAGIRDKQVYFARTEEELSKRVENLSYVIRIPLPGEIYFS